MPRKKESVIYNVSDGQGGTCGRVLRALLTQFDGEEFKLAKRINVRTPERVRKIVAEAKAAQGIIFYTLVSEDTRQAIKECCKENNVDGIDLLGTPLRALHDFFHRKPRSKPGLLYETDRAYFDRIEAIDYTLKHDDGNRMHQLGKAHVVLAGVSRSSKSATCFFLAYEGIRAANVPLIAGQPPPEPLLKLDPKKVIGLHVNTARLRNVREVRVKAMGGDFLPSYLDKREVGREVNAAKRMMDEHGWQAIDASYMAIEEIAKEVIRLRGLDRRR